jgi:hypothetical protein
MSLLGSGSGHRRTFPSQDGQGGIPNWSKANSCDLPLKMKKEAESSPARFFIPTPTPGHIVLPGRRLADPRGRSRRVLGRGRPATGRGLPHSRGTPPARRTRSHSKQQGCKAAAVTRPPGPVLRLPAWGPQLSLHNSSRTMARLVTRNRPGFLARLIGGIWCLLCVAGQVGQPAHLLSSWAPHPTPYPFWSLRGSTLFREALSRSRAFSGAWDRWRRVESEVGAGI